MRVRKADKVKPNHLPYKGVMSNVFGVEMTPNYGLCSDGSTIGNSMVSEYQIYDLKQKKMLTTQSIGFATNNLTEFFGLIHALTLCVDKGISKTVYTDSMTAIAWLSSKDPKTRFKFSSNPLIKKMLDRSLVLAKKWGTKKVNKTHVIVNGNIDVLFWRKNSWGEIPADFGRK